MPKKPEENLQFQVYAGSTRGVIAFTECQKHKKTSYELKEHDGEITAFEWGQSYDEILIGNKDGVVKIYNTGLSKYLQHVKNLNGKRAIVGFGVFDKKIIIGRSDGTVNIYDRAKKKHTSFSTTQTEDSTVNTLVYNEKRHVFATGGEKNDLKIWDVNNKSLFKAKSLGKDELELPIPTSIRGISFLNEDNVVACVSKEGMVLVYDEKAQRRPVQKYVEKKASFSCIGAYNDRQVFVGTTRGYLQLIDLRQGKCLKTFQPFAGAVTSIACDSSQPFVVSTSLDKHLRIHNIVTKEVVHKEYMKIGLTKVLMRPVVKEEPKEEETNSKVIDDEYEGMFDKMETINDDSDDDEVNVKIVKKKKKNKLGKTKCVKKIKSV